MSPIDYILSKLTGKRLWLLFGALFALGAGLRLYDLSADPPNHFASLGQALLTDPYHITAHARNKVLFGQWEPFGYERWVAFKVSLVSALAYVVFSVSEVSRYTANLTAVILNLCGCVFLVAGIYRSPENHGDRRQLTLAALIAGVLLAVSHPLVVYARAPFLENGLLALAGAVFYVVTVHGRTIRGAALAGVLVALCPLAGKLFGVVIFFPAALTLALSGRHWPKRVSVFCGSAALTAVLWYALVLSDQTSAYHAYLAEQSLGLYGMPPGLTSLKTFIVLLVTYGAEFRLFRFEALLPVLAFVGIIGFSFRHQAAIWKKDCAFWRDRPALTFLALWTVVAWLGLMVFHYRPMRYSLFVLLPLIGAIGMIVGEALSSRRLQTTPFARTMLPGLSLGLIVFALAVVITQAALALTPDVLLESRAHSVVWSGLAVAVVCGGLFWFARNSLARIIGGDVFKAVTLALVFVSVGYQSRWNIQALWTTTHDMRKGSEDLGALIEGEAVITGPYAPTLTIDNHHKLVIYSFGLAEKQFDLFQKFPITHVAASVNDFRSAQRVYPEMSDDRDVVRWLVRNIVIEVRQLARDTTNRPAGVRDVIDAAMTRKDYAAALDHAREFISKHPDNREGRHYLQQVQMSAKRYTQALSTAHGMVKLDETDFNAHLVLARTCFILDGDGSRPDLRAEGERSLERALALNPAGAEIIRQSVQAYR